MTKPDDDDQSEQPPPVEDARRWFSFAENDFATATLAMREEEPAASTICYLCQQAAEKYLKGYLILNGWTLKRLHDLTALLAECMLYDSGFEALKEAAVMLNPYSVDARYPGDVFVHFSREDAQTAILKARQIIEFVKHRLKAP